MRLFPSKGEQRNRDKRSRLTPKYIVYEKVSRKMNLILLARRTRGKLMLEPTEDPNEAWAMVDLTQLNNTFRMRCPA